MGKNTRRRYYGVWFECLRPGLWRSDCGWYVLQKLNGTKTLWRGIDMETGRRIIADGVSGAAWHAMGLTLERWKNQ